MTAIQTMNQVCNPIQRPHQAVPKSGNFAVRMLTKAADPDIGNTEMTSKNDPNAQGDNVSVLIPRNAIVWVLGLFALSGVGGPLFNNLSARNVTADAAAIAEQGKTITMMLERFDRTLGDVQKHLDEIDARVTRMERSDRNRKVETP